MSNFNFLSKWRKRETCFFFKKGLCFPEFSAFSKKIGFLAARLVARNFTRALGYAKRPLSPLPDIACCRNRVLTLARTPDIAYARHRVRLTSRTPNIACGWHRWCGWDSIQLPFVFTQYITVRHCFQHNNLLFSLHCLFCFYFILCFWRVKNDQCSWENRVCDDWVGCHGV